MHKKLLEQTIESVRRRVAQGDHPTEPAYTVEWLEDALLSLAGPRPAENPDPVAA